MSDCKHKQIQELDFITRTVLRCMQRRKEFRVKAICAACKARIEIRYEPTDFHVIGARKAGRHS